MNDPYLSQYMHSRCIHNATLWHISMIYHTPNYLVVWHNIDVKRTNSMGCGSRETSSQPTTLGSAVVPPARYSRVVSRSPKVSFPNFRFSRCYGHTSAMAGPLFLPRIFFTILCLLKSQLNPLPGSLTTALRHYMAGPLFKSRLRPCTSVYNSVEMLQNLPWWLKKYPLLIFTRCEPGMCRRKRMSDGRCRETTEFTK